MTAHPAMSARCQSRHRRRPNVSPGEWPCPGRTGLVRWRRTRFGVGLGPIVTVVVGGQFEPLLPAVNADSHERSLSLAFPIGGRLDYVAGRSMDPDHTPLLSVRFDVYPDGIRFHKPFRTQRWSSAPRTPAVFVLPVLRRGARCLNDHSCDLLPNQPRRRGTWARCATPGGRVP